jgi:hypothetical protein
LSRLHHIVLSLQAESRKSNYLALMRVLLSLWYLQQLFFRRNAFELIYSNDSILRLQSSWAMRFFHLDTSYFRADYPFLLGLAFVLLALNLFGIGRNAVAFLLFLMMCFLYWLNDNYGNGGDKMALMLLFYLSFADTYARFTLFSESNRNPERQALINLTSNLAALSIMLNLCLGYFMAFAHKLEDPLWINGTSIRFAFNDERFGAFAFNRWLGDHPIPITLLTYSVLLFEASFPFLVWLPRWRKTMLVAGILLHTGIFFMLAIYGMSVIFMIPYGLFLSNATVEKWLKKIRPGKRKAQVAVNA